MWTSVLTGSWLLSPQSARRPYLPPGTLVWNCRTLGINTRERQRETETRFRIQNGFKLNHSNTRKQESNIFKIERDNYSQPSIIHSKLSIQSIRYYLHIFWHERCKHFIHYTSFLQFRSIAQLCLTLGNPMDCSPSGFSAHGVFQARILEWTVIPLSRGSSPPWLNQGLLHSRLILYRLSYREAPFSYKFVFNTLLDISVTLF